MRWLYSQKKQSVLNEFFRILIEISRLDLLEKIFYNDIIHKNIKLCHFQIMQGLPQQITKHFEKKSAISEAEVMK